jgi:hypothetical protein
MEKYFIYLDALRESGETNMFAAVPYLKKEFAELKTDKQAAKVLAEWMNTFSERHKNDK